MTEHRMPDGSILDYNEIYAATIDYNEIHAAACIMHVDIKTLIKALESVGYESMAHRAGMRLKNGNR